MNIKFLSIMFVPFLVQATEFSEDIGLLPEDEAFLFGLSGVLVGFTIFFSLIQSVVNMSTR